MLVKNYVGEEGYLRLLDDIMIHGKDRGDRTGTGTRSLFSATVMFDLQERFPLLTTKKMATKSIFGELLWFLSGDSDLGSLRTFTFGFKDNQRTIWDDNIVKYSGSNTGSGGLLYGVQWREFAGRDSGLEIYSDQISELLEEASQNPESRRLLVNAWNSAEIREQLMALPPCHFAFQLYIEDGFLNLKWNQRSCDAFLGVPFNIASYAALTHIFARILGLKPGILIGDLTNVHIYNNHFDAVREQLENEIIKCDTRLLIPNITLDNIRYFSANDFVIEKYESHKPIKAPMAF